MANISTLSTQAFIEDIGINAQLRVSRYSYYVDPTGVFTALKYLGIGTIGTNLRINDPTTWATRRRIGERGH